MRSVCRLPEALLAYRDGDYGRVVDLLLPIRYDFHRIGYSHVQRRCVRADAPAGGGEKRAL